MRLEHFDGWTLLLLLGALHYAWALYDRRRLRRIVKQATEMVNKILDDVEHERFK